MLTFRRQSACLILPSADQGSVFESQAEFVVHHPRPFRYKGQYQHFVLYVDKRHIRRVVATLDFVPS